MPEVVSNPAKTRGRILLVEDDETFRSVLGHELGAVGFDVRLAGSPAAAEAILAARPADLILLDERLPGMTGLNWLVRLRERGNRTPVVFLTGHGDVQTAVAAIQAGAFHFLTKPCKLVELIQVIDKALASLGLAPAPGAPEPAETDELVGESPKIVHVREMIRKMAAAEAPVLVCGESGTGKELVAKTLHRLSARGGKAFVALNCATLQDTLVEAELFGAERGAYTGAHQTRPGLIEAAEGGTLFLDELAELSLPAQAKLLRVLQEATFRRVGASQERSCDIRLVAATNRPLAEAIEAGRFRQDLYFRLNILELGLPPLRERPEDLPLLVRHYYRLRGQAPPAEVESASVQKALATYRWPGNVRELYNVLQRVAILSGPGRFDRAVLDEYLAMVHVGAAETEALPDRLDDLEMLHIRNVLDRCQGNKTQAAKVLGISLKTLYNKLHRRDPDDETAG